MKTLGRSSYRNMSKREYLAAMAMQGLLANAEFYRMFVSDKPEVLIHVYSKTAIEHTDELLKQLEQ